MNEADDLISVLTEEHRDLRMLLAELERLTGNQPLRRSLTDLMLAEVVRHVLAEEIYLYPIARRRLLDGQRIVDHHAGEHEQLERMLHNLERHDLSSTEFARLLSRLDAGVRAHTQWEEQHLFPLIAAHLSQEELSLVGRKAVEAKQKAVIPQCHAEMGSLLLDRIITSGRGMVERVRAFLRDFVYPS